MFKTFVQLQLNIRFIVLKLLKPESKDWDYKMEVKIDLEKKYSEFLLLKSTYSGLQKNSPFGQFTS